MSNQPERYVKSNTAPYHSVDTIAPQRSPLNEGASGFSVSYRYLNGLGHPIHVIQRSGIITTIPSNPNSAKQEIVIRVELRTGWQVKIDSRMLLHSSMSSNKALATAISRVIDEGLYTEERGEHIWRFDYYVTADELNSGGGSLYLDNLDVVVSTLRVDLAPYHPFSEQGIRDKQLEENGDANDVDTFSYSLKIVDNSGTYGRRFININGAVYRVPSSHDPKLPDGVYLVSTGPSEVDGGYTRPKSERYTFPEADEKLHLYRTIEEARTLGDQLAQRKKEIEETGLWIKQEEQRIKREEQDLKRRVADEEADRKRQEADFNTNIKRQEAEFKRQEAEFHAELKRQEAEFKRQEEELQTELKRQEAELKRQMEQERYEEERRRQQEQSEHERRIKRLKEEEAEIEHRRKMDEIRRKDEFDQRSHERKDTSEIVKFLPAIATGVLALFVAFSKLNS